MAPKPSAEVWHSPGAGPFCNLSWTGNQDANSVGTVWTLFFINLVIWSAITGMFFATVETKRGLSPKVMARVHYSIHPWGVRIQILIAFFSVLSCFGYVADTYKAQYIDFCYTEGMILILFCFEVVFSVGFAANYLICWHHAQDRVFYPVTDMMAVIDELTVIPVFIDLFAGMYPGGAHLLDADGSAGLAMFSMLRVLKALRVVRLLRMFKAQSLMTSAVKDDAITHGKMQVLYALVSLLILVTGVVQLLSSETAFSWGEGPALWNVPKNEPQLAFHDALYFTAITLTTVGYGDVSPSGWLGRCFLIVVALAAITFIPMKIQQLNGLIALRSQYAQPYVQSAEHIVISGDISSIALRNFLGEFFHPDRGVQSSKVVLLMKTEPDLEMNELLLLYAANTRVQWVLGDPMATSSLISGGVDRCDAFFFLTNEALEDPGLEDANTIVNALAVRRFRADLPVYMQLILPESRNHSVLPALKLENVLAIDQFKMSLMAASIMCPGLPALLTNLVSSTSAEITSTNSVWKSEYCEGLTKEVYKVQLHDRYRGLSFRELAKEIWETSRITCFALALPTAMHAVLLNPVNVVIPMKGCTHAFLVAEDDKSIETLQDDGEIHELMSQAKSRASFLQVMPMDDDDDGGGGEPCYVPPVDETDGGGMPPQVDTTFGSGDRGGGGGSSPPAMPVPPSPLGGPLGSGSIGAGPSKEPCMFTPQSCLAVPHPLSITRSRSGSDAKAVDPYEIIHDVQSVFASADYDQHVMILTHVPAQIHFLALEICHLMQRVSEHQHKPTVRMTLTALLQAEPSRQVLVDIATTNERYSHILQVNIIVGQHTDFEAMRRAGVEQATCIIVLADAALSPAYTKSEHVRARQTPSDFSDNAVIKNILTIEAHLSSYLGANHPDELYAPRLRKYFIGEILAESHVRHMNPMHWVDKPHVDLEDGTRTGLMVDLSESEHFMEPAFAAGQVVVHCFFENVLCQSYFNRQVLTVVNSMLGMAGQSSGGSMPAASASSMARAGVSDCLSQLPVPPEMFGRDYNDLFLHMLDEGALAMGVYRVPHKDEPDVCLPYCVTCPTAPLQLREGDFIYVLDSSSYT